jgi:hypothetical protein
MIFLISLSTGFYNIDLYAYFNNGTELLNITRICLSFVPSKKHNVPLDANINYVIYRLLSPAQNIFLI